jgi:hypothetical protein
MGRKHTKNFRSFGDVRFFQQLATRDGLARVHLELSGLFQYWPYCVFDFLLEP